MWVRGWASVPLVLLAVIVGPLCGELLARTVGGGLITFAAGMLLGVPLTDLAGILVNSRRKQGSSFWRDREWHGMHAFSTANLPVHGLFLLPALFALLASFMAVSELRPEDGAVRYLLPVAIVLVVAGYVTATRWRALRAVRFSWPGRRVHRPDVVKKLRLFPGQAAEGLTTTVRYRVRTACPKCDGTGYGAQGRPCLACAHTGVGRRTRAKVTIKVPPGVRHGTIVKVRGRGTPPIGGRPAGDVLLQVVVAGASRTPRPAPAAAAAPRTTTVPPPRAPYASPHPHAATPRTSPTAPSARPSSAPAASRAPRTVSSDGVRLTVDTTGFSVETERLSTGTRTWSTEARMAWGEVSTMEFSSGPHDPIPALYVVPRSGPRRFVLDQKQFTRADWQLVADAVSACTDGRVGLQPPRHDDVS